MIEDVPGLLIKEAADKRARNRDCIEALTGWYEGRSSISVLDLSAGIGANVRALAPLLPNDQTWTLCARHQREADEARDYLTRWDPAFKQDGDVLKLQKDGTRLDVRIVVANPVRDLVKALEPRADLVTVSLDAVRYPAAMIRQLAAHVAQRKAAFYGNVIYDGRLRFSPHHAADSAMTAAFHRSLMRDDGAGAAAGPMAASELAEQFRLAEYTVIEGSSAVWLRGPEAALMRQIQTRMADAQRTIAKGHDKTIDTWLARPRTGLEISQTDILALPA
jgi:hypothetical protein